MQRFWIGLTALAALLFQANTALSGKPLLELKVGDNAYVGRSLARDDQTCWIQASDGRLTRLLLQRVTEFRKVSPNFRQMSVIDARDQLSREWSRSLETAAAGSYAVAAPRGKAQAYATLLDEVHRSFSTFFSRRNFGLEKPEFPLMAIIFPNAQEFAAYCQADGMSYSPGLRGYYNPETNRIAFFEDNAPVTLGPRDPNQELLQAALGPFKRPDDSCSSCRMMTRFESAGTIDANFRDTLVHEATHQIAFNMGLHTRIGENPRWVVEGLAMIFERNQDGSNGRGSERQRINAERYEWFMQRTRQDVVPLEKFLATDRTFSTATLDAYAQAWALTFYLSERRAGDFAKYLQVIQKHDPFEDYTGEMRVADFQAAFGKDIDWLQVEWLRFMDAL